MAVQNVNLLDDPRIGFAAERTLLAWIRTGLAMMGFGFVVARFGLFLREMHPVPTAAQSNFNGSVEIGAGMIVLGVVINVLAAISHIRAIRRLKRGELYQPSTFSLAITVTLAIAMLGILMTIRLLGVTG